MQDLPSRVRSGGAEVCVWLEGGVISITEDQASKGWSIVEADLEDLRHERG